MPAACCGNCSIVSWVTGVCWWLSEGWAWGTGGVLNDVVDAVAEATIDVLLAFISFSSFFSAFFFALHVSTECLVFPQNVHFSSSWLGVEQNFALWSLFLHFLQVTFLWQHTVGWFFLPHFWHCSVCCRGWVVTNVIDCCEVIDAATFAMLATLVICKKRYPHRWNLGHSLTYRQRDCNVHPNLCSGHKTNWCNRLI